ncbi:hypothetical protein FSG36_023515 [Escherichia coli]|nr:hypothetical protein [Escherichia coli]MCJ2709471.1 hypothetical protein [Escherichia coli]
MDESRKQFEESWLRRGGESSDLIRYPENHHEIGSGNIGGQYVMDDVQSHWQTWQASRAAIELDIDWPESNDDFWKDGEEGAYAMGYEDGRDKTVIAVMKAIRAAGIKEKNFDEANNLPPN